MLDPIEIANDLIDVATALATERDLARLLDAIASAARRLTRAQVARILVLDVTGRALEGVLGQNEVVPEAAATPGPIALYREDAAFNLTDPNAFSAITGRLVSIADVYAYTGFEFGPTYQQDRATGFRTRSFAVLPLRNAERTLGVLQLANFYDREAGEVVPLAAATEPALRSFAAQAAVAIGNARLFAENQQLIRRLDRANAELAQENAQLREEAQARFRRGGRENGVIGESPAILDALDLARRAAASKVPVLLLGETGTGKEVFARTIHRASERSRKAIVTQNCAALPEHLLESELFGHRKGAFSGAVSDKRGLVHEADGGTLFLDEIGDMPLNLQAKILRMIELGEVRRVGDVRTDRVDVRIVAATHVDLKRKIADGGFREDLFYRLSVFPITLPPLRERRGDVPRLVDHFLAAAAELSGRPVPTLTPEALDALAMWTFPGNVRELKNIVERAVLLVDQGERIGVEHLPTDLRAETPIALPAGAALPPGADLKAMVEQFEAVVIRTKLRETGGNQSRAADLLNISRRSFIEKLRRYGIRPSRTA